MEKIIENVTIIYKNGKKEFYNAINAKTNGIYIGEIKFISQGFIPKNQIRKIIFLDQDVKSNNLEKKKTKGEEIRR